jgi:hypothetical protein
MGSRTIAISAEQFQDLVRLTKAIRETSTGAGKLTSPDSLAKAFIERGIEDARRDWYVCQANSGLSIEALGCRGLR